MPYTYFPAIRTKSGESTALSYLTQAEKARICPILQIVEQTPESFNNAFASAWSGRYAILDGSFDASRTGNASNFIQKFHSLTTNGVNVSPCYVMGADPHYNSAVQNFFLRNSAPLTIKTSINNIPSMIKFLSDNAISKKSIILVIDLSDISGSNTETFKHFVLEAIKKDINTLEWQSVVLLAGSAPKDHSSLSLGRNIIPRQEWDLWKFISSNFSIHYGDYLTLHPDLTPAPAIAMTSATVSVRYTIEDYWIIYKGVRASGPNGLSMTSQYIQHAQNLIKEQEFKILTTSWSDNEILRIASMPLGSAKGAGGRTQWAGYSINRHLSLVAAQLP